MSEHSQQTPQPSAKTAGTTATDRWIEWVKTVFANGTKQSTATTPFYDSELRELRVGSVLVKHFTQASDAQEILLAVFQEESWCRRIDDPLPVKATLKLKAPAPPAVAVSASVSEPTTIDLHSLGARWRAGEKISALAREAGMVWNKLWSDLDKLGYRPQIA